MKPLATSPRQKQSPAVRQARLARDVVEEILLGVKMLPRRVDRPKIVQAFESTLIALTDLAASSLDKSDHLDLLTEARGRLAGARAVLASHDEGTRVTTMLERLRAVERALELSREATIDALVFVQSDVLNAELARRGLERLPEPEAFGVSFGVPRLFALERDALRANVDVAAPSHYIFDEELGAIHDPGDTTEAFDSRIELDPEEDTLDHDDDAVVRRLTLLGGDDLEHPGMVSGVAGELAHLERIARDCMEEIGMLSNMRRLRDHERFRWPAIQRFEQRILNDLDALLAMATPFYSCVGHEARVRGVDVLDAVLRYSRDSPAIHEGRAFARAFVLGCVAGEDTVRALVLALKQSHPQTHAAQARALSIAKNPAIDAAMRALTTDEDPRLVALALDVLDARADGDTVTALQLLEHPHPDIRARAARALGTSRDRDAALAALQPTLDEEIEDQVWVAAVEAAIMLRSAEGVRLARERLAEALEEPEILGAATRTRLMQVLAVTGGAQDGELLAELYLGDRDAATALGFAGHVQHVDVLLDAISPPTVFAGPGQLAAAADALVRITGAPMQRVRHDGDRDFYDVHTDHERWNAWWDDNRKRFDPKLRYRFGEPWSPIATIDELLRDEVPHGLRKLLALELDLTLGRRTIHLSHLAAAQERSLGRARASLGDDFEPGAWPRL